MPLRTTGMVRNSIRRSVRILAVRMYSRSSRTHSEKLTILLRPLICHKQVIPGFTQSLRCCQYSKRSASDLDGGRGPHQTHIALENAIKLRQLIQTELAQYAAKGSDPRIVAHLERSAVHLIEREERFFKRIGIGNHRAKLVAQKRPAILPKTAHG